jgi:G3E family GTPase
MLCGSLGAGKTTLLMRLLEYWKQRGRRAGVLMNEAGEISIDGPRVGTIAEQVMNLAGGCVCCDTKEDLSWGIAQLVRDYGSDLIVLECSGLADPAEVIDGVTDLYTARLAQLERVIALLHPIAGAQSPSSVFVTEQAIRCADELILNKLDLYVPGHWEQFKASVLARNPSRAPLGDHPRTG